MQMKNTYGSITCASGSTLDHFSPTHPGRSIASPIPAMPTAVTASKNAPTSVVTRRASRHPAASPSWRRARRNSGMNAADSAPSPNSARNRFGIRNATTNADIASVVPKNFAMKISRTNPSMRLSNVNPPTVNADRMMFRFSIPYPSVHFSKQLGTTLLKMDNSGKQLGLSDSPAPIPFVSFCF